MSQLMSGESVDRQWFALGFDGSLYALGDCGDYEAADEIANDLCGDEAIWLVDPESAHQWSDLLNARIGR